MEEKLTKAQLKEQRHNERKEYELRMKNEEVRIKIKKILFWVFGAGILGLIVWGMFALISTPTTASNSSITMPKLDSTDITLGPKNAKVTLVEYADFQCPACSAYFPIVQKLHAEYQGKVLFAYRYFPLTNIHRNAMISAQAAQAANLQGKFWEMHDLLYQNQNAWAQQVDPTQTFVGYAKQLHLDTDKFLTDMSLDTTKKFINDKEDAGTTAGVNATPTFFLNGSSIVNPANYDEFKKLIDEKLK